MPAKKLASCIFFLYVRFFGSLYDLEISTALFKAFGDPGENVLGLTFSAFMPLVSWAFIAFGGGYSLKFSFDEKKWYIKTFCILVAIAAFFFPIYYTGNKVSSVNAFDNPKLDWLGYPLAILVEGGIYVGGYFACKKYRNTQFYVYTIILFVLMGVCFIGFTNLVKNIMNRPRYRTIAENSSFFISESKFVNWWQSFRKEYTNLETLYGDAIEEEFRSLPSGHCSDAAMTIFGVTYLTMVFPQLKGKETSLSLIFT